MRRSLLGISAVLIATACGDAQTPPTTLFATTAAGDLYSIDRVTGVPSLVGSTGLSIQALSPSIDRTTLLASRRTPSAIELYEIDPGTAVPTLVQSLPSTWLLNLRGMAMTGPAKLLLGGQLPSGPGCPNTCSGLSLIDLSTGTVNARASASFGSSMSYDAARNEIDSISSDGTRLWVYNAGTLAPAGVGFVFGTGSSTSCSIEIDASGVFYIAGDRL